VAVVTASAGWFLAPAGAAAAPVAVGAFIPGAWQRPALIDEYARKTGRAPAIVLSYKDWSTPLINREELREVARRGAVPMITWEPWDSQGRGIPLRSIMAGAEDEFLRRSARAAAAWSGPIMLRFAQEMNGNWFPWGQGVGSNTPLDFRLAWHQVVRVFRREGARNVIWVWAPNEDSGGDYPLKTVYPGDGWVDWAGIDGFNWGGEIGWASFTEVFGSTYDRLVEFTSKPIVIAETGSGDELGDKAEWIASAFRREIPRFPHVRALVWFDVEEARADFRIDSSEEALDAFRTGVASPGYGAGREALLSVPATLPGAAPAPPEPSGGYGAPSFLDRVRWELRDGYGWAAAGGLLALILCGTAVLFWVRRRSRVQGAG
jgi:Glycosyl hydrolase family 26